MDGNEKLQWSMLEYEERERSSDWFWALGVVIVTASLAAIIYADYFFAVLLIIAGALLGFFATKKPDIVSYELNHKGLKIGSRLYPYENIKSFWVQGHTLAQNEMRPILFLKSERAFMPILSIPIEQAHIEDIHTLMLEKNIPEEEMKEHPTEKIIEVLGF